MLALLLAAAASARHARRPSLPHMRTKDIALLVDDYNSDAPTLASRKFMKALRVPKSVAEEDPETNGYVRCRPFVISRRQLRNVVNRYVSKAFFGLDTKEADATLLGYSMLPKAADMKQFQENDDDEMIGVSQPGVKSGTEVIGQEKPMAALVAKHLKLSQPERLRLHLRAKPKIPLCRNTIMLI